MRLWGASFDNLLWDPSGCQAFKAFLEKEFSSENLRFWLSVNAYQFTPVSNLKAAGQRIYEEFLGPNAPSEINIDCSTRVNTAKAVKVGYSRSFGPFIGGRHFDVLAHCWVLLLSCLFSPLVARH